MKQTLTKQEINCLFKEGKWLVSQNVKVIYKPSSNFGYMVSAPIKKFKKANKRNKIKRLLRLSLQNFNKPFYISIIYNSDEILDFDTINKEVDKLLTKIS